MAYWTACRLQPNRTALALHFLNLQGYEVYCPQLHELRARRGVNGRPPTLCHLGVGRIVIGHQNAFGTCRTDFSGRLGDDFWKSRFEAYWGD
jgi:hypothetical protein